MREDLRDRLLLPVLLPLGVLAFIFGLVFGLSRILLSAPTETAAVVVGVLVGGSIVLFASMVAASQRIRALQLVSMLGLVLGVALIAGGAVSATFTEEGEEAGGGPGGPPPVEVQALAGAAVEGFATPEVTAPAGEPFAIRFDNADTGVRHNLHLFTEDANEKPDAESIAASLVETGSVVQNIDVAALDPGQYFFRCDVHPTTMTGTLVAEKGPAGGEEGGLEITAQDIAFDRSELTLPPGEQVTVVFHNEDAEVTHNVAIYTERGGEEIFVGDAVTGVATKEYTFEAPEPGTYYFQCDFHPDQMNGTVRVT